MFTAALSTIAKIGKQPVSIDGWMDKQDMVYTHTHTHNGLLLNLKKEWGLVQDGGVEGRALTPSCENTRIATNCWTIIDRKTLELTKKDTPHPKTKEKPQWDGRRDAITIKSNPITAGWVTYKLENTYTTEVHHWSEGSEPTSGFRTWGSGNGRRDS